jgi:membrane-associated HD superfamily phosphohydrolase
MLAGLLLVASLGARAQTEKKMFYRYTTNAGHKVVSQSIPPQYIRNGYELLTMTGEIVKVVPPAPAEADAERIANERKVAKEQAKLDKELRQTYSSPQDIEDAKVRNLQELMNTVSILQANLVSVKSQLKVQEAHAANIERSGKALTSEVLNNITTLRTDDKDLNVQIKQREAEYQLAAAKYDKDKLRFIEITKPKP